MTKVTIVSDSHLSLAAPEADANWDAVVAHVTAERPDVVVHAGDLSLDGAHDAEDLRHARRQLDRLPVVWHAVPGNHDIGDDPWPGLPDSEAVDAERTERWIELVGPDHWSLDLGKWELVAINAQLLGSGLEAESAQWSWLEARLGTRRADRRVALVTHKPLVADDEELAVAPPYRFVPDDSRQRLLDLLRVSGAALVVSGHVHQYRVLDVDNVRHLWAPTTWTLLPDDLQPTLGTKRAGVVTLELGDVRLVEPQLVEPEGLRQLTLLVDVANPYRH